MSRAPFDPSIDYYRLLGVAPQATTADIHAAYRRLAKAYHPDLHAGSSVAAARMARLNAAKTVLLNVSTRAAYDEARRLLFGGTSAASATRAGAAYGRPGAAPIVRTYVRSHVAPAPPRPAPAPVVEAKRGGWLDRQTMLLIGMAFPLLAALVFYVVDGVQVASRPAQPVTSDIFFSPNTRPTPENTARAAHSLVASSQQPNRHAAGAAYHIILNLIDNSPEASMLRAVGRRLYVAGRDGDSEAWFDAVNDLCRLAREC